jgi:nucleoside-diphosphate-sugar epimerase
MAGAREARVLVTGASGFIGRHALARLAGRGFAVHAVARDPARIPGVAGVRGHAADLLDPAAAAALIAAVRPTHLLHFAWYAEHGKFWSARENLDWLGATLNLLRLFAEGGGTRFVGAGTCAEYDWTGDAGLLDEARTPLRPATLYGAAKASAFLAGEAYARGAGVSFAWGRVFHLFGAGEAPGRLVPALARAHLRGEPLDCGRGDARRDFLPVESVADAFAALCAGEVAGPVNIGGGEGITVSDLSDKIAAIAAGTARATRGDIRFGALPDAGPASLVPAVNRLAREVGWTNPETLDAALARAVTHWSALPERAAR